MKKRSFKKNRLSILSLILLFVLIVYSISLAYPILWGVMTSLKDDIDYMTNKVSLIPSHLFMGNYKLAWDNLYAPVTIGAGTAKLYMDGMIVNSLIYSLGCAICATAAPCIMAYLCSKYQCKFSSFIHALVLIVITIPIVGSLPSQMAIVSNLGLKNTFVGMFVLSSSFTGLYFLVFYATFKSLPKDYMEAAQIDGSGHFRIFFTIMLPLSFKTLLTIFIIYFIQFWNDYTTPMLFMPNKPTLSYGVYFFTVLNNTNSISSDQVQIAGCMVVLIPILIIFLSMHKTLMGNLTAGGLKG